MVNNMDKVIQLVSHQGDLYGLTEEGGLVQIHSVCDIHYNVSKIFDKIPTGEK